MERDKSHTENRYAPEQGLNVKLIFTVWCDIYGSYTDLVSSGPGHLSLVIEMLQRECDRQAGRIVAELRKHRRLDAIVASVQNTLR